MKSMSCRTQALSFSEATYLNSFSVILLFIPFSTFIVDQLTLQKVIQVASRMVMVIESVFKASPSD